jgi:hypothetical protein
MTILFLSFVALFFYGIIKAVSELIIDRIK